MRVSDSVKPIVFLLALLIVPPLEAHNRSQSFSAWSFENKKLDLVFTVKSREATRLQSIYELNLEDSITRHILETVKVAQGSGVCHLDKALKPEARVVSLANISVSVTFNCPLNLNSSMLNIEVGSFFGLIPSHTHYARILFNNSLPMEHLFTDSNRVWEFYLQNNHNTKLSSRTFFNFMSIGIKHILSGLDHIMFLLALLLMLPNLRGLICLVSGFTVGHSVSLCLATFGFVAPDSLRIEALIGFTIALASAESVGARHNVMNQISLGSIVFLSLLMVILNFSAQEMTMSTISLFGLMIFSWNYLQLNDISEDRLSFRTAVCLVFGLVHGFGFATGLSELGLQSEGIWMPLLGFNLGVEIGQLLIVLFAWLFYILLRGYKLIYRASIEICSGVVCGAGVYWFVMRSLTPLVR